MSGHFNYLIKFKAKKKEFIFDEKLLKQLNKKNDDSLFHFICDFTLTYVSYQQKQLERNKITPYELLRLNGMDIIAILSNKPVVEKFLNEVLKELSSNYQRRFHLRKHMNFQQ